MNGTFLSAPKQAEEHTTICAEKVGMNVNKAFGQSLCVVRCTVPKEVSNPYQTTTISTISG